MTDVHVAVQTDLRKRRRRIRSSRKVRFLLMSVGLAGVLLGVGLLVWGLLQSNPSLGLLGLVYLACAGGVLCVRAAMETYDRVRRRRYARE